MPCTVLVAARAGTCSPLLAHSMDTAGPNDFRLIRVPPNRNPPAPRPVYRWDERAVPRFFGIGRGPIPGYSDGSYWIDNDATSLAPELIGHIPQTERSEGTFGYWEAAGGIANDNGVMIGESTCSAIYGAELCGSAGGEALLGYMELTRIALERCIGAREAVELMGELAVEHGFAGNSADLMGSAESLSVVDAEEAWVMHILPDHTGSSAIWAAQRLEEGHAACVPNAFIIREMRLEEGHRFLVSPNAKDEARRAGRWQPGEPFDFAALFSAGEPSQRFYCGRRQWRALSLFAPSLRLPAEYEDLIQDAPYPFSVASDEPLAVSDLRSIMRDTFEGSPFDLARQQPAAGPFGVTDRYDSFAYPRQTAAGGGEERIPLFERAIGVHRMAYSYIGEPSRARLPVVHFAPHASLSSVYLPVLCTDVGSAPSLPSPLSCGSVKALDRRCAYWAFRAVKHCARGLVWNRCLAMIRQRQLVWEARADEILDGLVDDGGAADETRNERARATALQATSEALQALACNVVADWWALNDEMLVRFGDGYEWVWSEDGASQSKAVEYPVEWLERVAAWERVES